MSDPHMGGLGPNHYPPGSAQEREWLVSEHARLLAEVERLRRAIASVKKRTSPRKALQRGFRPTAGEEVGDE